MDNKVMVMLLLTTLALITGTLTTGIDEGQNEQNKITNIKLELNDTKAYITWNPIGDVPKYKILWSSGKQVLNKTTDNSKSETIFEHLPYIQCFRPFNITVVPLNDEEMQIGEGASHSYVWKDVITDIMLKETSMNGEKLISATWTLDCRSRSFIKLRVKTWKEDETDDSAQTSFEVANRREACFSVICSKDINGCPAYNVMIQQTPQKSIPVSGSFSTFKLQYHSLHPTSVVLAWNKMNSDCNVTGYTIEFNTPVQWQDPIKKQANATQANIDSLQPSTDYQLCITAQRFHKKKFQSCVSFKTPESETSAPISLEVRAINDSHAQITWQQPGRINSTLLNYNLVLFDGNGEVAFSITTEKESFTVLCTIDPIHISVSAETTTGKGESAWTTMKDVCIISTPTSPSSSTSASPSQRSIGKIANEAVKPWMITTIVLSLLLVLVILVVVALSCYLCRQKSRKQSRHNENNGNETELQHLE